MELEKIPSLIAVATFAALSVVVAYDWGYFGVIGIDFQSLYTTYDYISEMLVSMGPAFVAMVCVLAVQAAVLRQANFDTGADNLKSSWGKWLLNWYLEVLWGIGFVLALLFSDETMRSGLFMLLGLLWIRIIGYIYSHAAFDAFKKTVTSWIVLGLPALMIAMYGIGRDGAYIDLKSTKDNLYSLHAKNRFLANR